MIDHENHLKYLQTDHHNGPAHCIEKAIGALADKYPDVRKWAAISLRSCISDGMDITSALTFLERALFDENHEVREQAALTLKQYALSMYKVDIASALNDLVRIDSVSDGPSHYPLSTEVVTTAPVTHESPLCENDDIVMMPGIDRKVIMIPFERFPEVPLIPFTHKSCIEYFEEIEPCEPICLPFDSIVMDNQEETSPYVWGEPVSTVAVTDAGEPLTESCKKTRPLYSRRLKQPERHMKAKMGVWLSMMIAIVVTVIISFNEISTGSNNIPGIITHKPLLSAVQDHQAIAKPDYLTRIDKHRQRFMNSELSVYHVLEEDAKENREFTGWFNSLDEEQKRGFILFVRSVALSEFIGNKKRFSKKHWVSGRPENIRELTGKYLEDVEIINATRKFEAIYSFAHHQRSLFMANNRWLHTFLGESYSDFEKGLLHFFSEHSFSNSDVTKKSYRFSDLKLKIMTVSKAIIADRGGHTRISPKKEVTDRQIKEIVAAAFFAELFYGIPADFIALISAYETNFSMEYWEGGFGTTQQTTRAANTVLQSDYWIGKVYESAGVKIRMQMVPISALDSVFLCITEGAKTIAIKAAELDIRTNEINTAKKVKVGGRTVPVTWATAYKYNGSKRYARQYATNINRYYRKKSLWLKSFSVDHYQLIALNE